MIKRLIFDIESHTVGDKPNSNKDIFKVIGLYEYETNAYHVLSYKDKEKILEIFKRHRVVIGFNSKYFDEPIMKRCGFWKYTHTHLDLREIIKKRADLLGCKYELFSLDNLAKFFKLDSVKFDIDYDIFKNDEWTNEEWAKIVCYTKEDIVVTKKLFDKIHDFFEPMKEFMSIYDVRNYKWLTSSISVYAYKVICHQVGLKEEYNNTKSHEIYEGGFVAFPNQEYTTGKIYCLDFNSLYPHNMIQGNLFSTNCKCCKEKEKWRGNDMFKLKGAYCSKKQGKIEDTIQNIYNKRKELKSQGNKLEYALKIVINTVYGLMGNPVFESLYNYFGAADCTLIGRESIKYARKVFMNAGYNVIYSDTDSVYLEDTHNNEDILMTIKRKIIAHIQANLQFPSKTFDMGIDERIKYIWFFKSGDTYKKKHYMYVTEDNKLVIKGLPMIKNDSSGLGYIIFNKYMKDQIIKGDIKFDYNDVKKWAYNEIKKDITIVARKFKVWSVDSYKQENQIQAQISRKYGHGVHLLIPNKRIGVGKSIKYCTIDEFKSSGLSTQSIDLTKMWSELKPFIKTNVRKQERLLQWTNIQ